MNIPASYCIATAEQSRTIDACTVDWGIDAFTLMEVAGMTATKYIREEVPAGSHGVILCGKGNNGGDGLVAARYLAQQDIAVTVVFVASTSSLSELATKNKALLESIAAENKAADIRFIERWDNIDAHMQPDFIIDAMLGTGLSDALRAPFPEAVQWANDAKAPVIAMDIPTGLHADTGTILGHAIKATTTVSFGVRKQGYYLGQGPALAGRIRLCPLPFPDHLIHASCTSYIIDEDWLPDRSAEKARHKYESGVVYVIAGSEGLTGAAMMTARSAWAEGAGAVFLLSPRGLLPIYENNLPQIIKKPLGTHEHTHFSRDDVEQVLKIVQEKPGTVAIGPGLGRAETTISFVQQFLDRYTGRAVIDADALYALGQQDAIQKPAAAKWILTPHPGELHTLFGNDISADSARLQLVKHKARELCITLLAKGYPVMVGTPGEQCYITPYDTRVFSRAGFGDTLAGKIATFSAQGQPPAESCCRALLVGYRRAMANQSPRHTPEPLDLL